MQKFVNRLGICKNECQPRRIGFDAAENDPSNFCDKGLRPCHYKITFSWLQNDFISMVAMRCRGWLCIISVLVHGLRLSPEDTPERVLEALRGSRGVSSGPPDTPGQGPCGEGKARDVTVIV